MGEKSEIERKHTSETARCVYMKKGYKNVTMKDSVEACEISGGGLYVYFSSTRERFEAVLELEASETDDVFETSIKADATASDILALFLKEQKNEIVQKKSSLTVGIYEFFFENKVPKKANTLRKKFDLAVKGIQALI